ncbi:MAG: septum formation initiator family protein [Rickettsia endosymbiont of Bryobia graminum]|nr:septum formation initiator family protein [Rickettsia endosymbiont of Bryobia graminum]
MNYIYFTNSLRKSKKTILNIFLFLLLAYFVFHSIYGNRGIIAYFSLNRQLEKAYSELNSLKAERVELEHRVKLLRPESLDKDMLDQEARRILGMALPNEQVFTSASLKIKN